MMETCYITLYERSGGVPRFECTEYGKKTKDYVVFVPMVRERMVMELSGRRDGFHPVTDCADMVICGDGPIDRGLKDSCLQKLGVNALLVKRDAGKQGARLRAGFWWALQRGYRGIITVDENSEEYMWHVPRLIEKLADGYDLVQGSRFVKEKGMNRPLVQNIYARIISMTAHSKFTDAASPLRGYSSKYLGDRRVQPFRECFLTYDLQAYLSVRASQTGFRVCEIPIADVRRRWEKGPEGMMAVLLKNAMGAYAPKRDVR